MSREQNATTSRARPLRHWQAIALIAGQAAFALVLAVRLPLAPDETYYWEWSRNLDLGYYDQGPMVAWWIRASCWLLGDTPLGVRGGIVLAAAITNTFLYATALRLFDRRVAAFALLLTIVMPLAMAGAVVATYDPLLAMFWSAAAYALSRATLDGSRPAWLWCGLMLGLGFLSKHTMALLVPCVGLLLAGRADLRAWFRRPEPWMALGVGALVVAPNLWWQNQHAWVTYGHLLRLSAVQTHHGPLSRVGDFVGSQAALVGPLVFLGMLAALWRARRAARAPLGKGEWFLFCVSAPVLCFFLAMALKTKVQANWAATGWLGAAVLYAQWALQTRRRWRYALVAVATTAALSTLIVSPELRVLLGLRLSPRIDQMNKMHGGPELAQGVADEMLAMRRLTGEPVVAGAATYDTVSRLAFYLPGQPRTRCFFLNTRRNAYTIWPDRSGLAPGGNALVVDDFAPGDPHLPAFAAIFDRVEPAARPVPIYRRPLYEEPVHVYYLYRCYGYRPDPAVERPSR